MFVMKNKLGNVQIVAKTERRRDELISRGFVLAYATVKSLDEMKVEELNNYAAEHNIDISSAKNRAEKIAIIKAAENKN